MSERRSSTMCVVVERPDHHCGDDLVIIIIVTDTAAGGRCDMVFSGWPIKRGYGTQSFLYIKRATTVGAIREAI